MKLSGFAWHFHKRCDQYPNNNFKEMILVKPEEFMMICIKCRQIHASLKVKNSA